MSLPKTPHPDFDWAIAPVTRQTFFDAHFERAPLVVQRNDPAYYRGLVGVADIDRAVCDLGLQHPEVTVVRADRTIAAPDYCDGDGRADPVRVAQQVADGATLILGNLQERLPALAAFCRELESVFSARVQTNIYLTPPGGQGFRAHYDTHDVLVLQVDGSKRWRFYDTPVIRPLESQRFDPDRVEVGAQTRSFVLNPGDMAYVPRGLTHDAVATDETSLHVTTGLMTRCWADLLVEAVIALAHEDPDLRASLPAGHAADAGSVAAMAPAFAALVDRLRDPTAMTRALEEMSEAFVAARPPRVPGQLAQMAALPGLTGAARVAARPGLVYRLTEQPDDDGRPVLHLSCQGADIAFPAHVRPTLEAALAATGARIDDLPGPLDKDGKLVLVRRLVREGLLTAT